MAHVQCRGKKGITWESCFLFQSLPNILISQVENVLGVKVALAHVEYLLISPFNKENCSQA